MVSNTVTGLEYNFHSFFFIYSVRLNLGCNEVCKPHSPRTTSSWRSLLPTLKLQIRPPTWKASFGPPLRLHNLRFSPPSVVGAVMSLPSFLARIALPTDRPKHCPQDYKWCHAGFGVHTKLGLAPCGRSQHGRPARERKGAISGPGGATPNQDHRVLINTKSTANAWNGSLDVGTDQGKVLED
ncbi:hypothetical protein PMIN02_009511 [Paraphaeosphaeria minitans]